MDDRRDKDARLGEDIRLLGRLLGDTIRERDGEREYGLIEEIRQLAVASRRREDTASREQLARTLDGLTSEEAVDGGARVQPFLGARQHRRGPPPHPPRARHPARGRPAAAVHRARALRGVRRAAACRPPTRRGAWRASACTRCSPRTRPRCSARARSTPARHRRRAGAPRFRRGAARRDRGRRAGDAPPRRDRSGRRACCAPVKLGVRDEIENAIAYFNYTFIAEVPRAHRRRRGRDRRAAGAPRGPSCRPSCAVGSWVGGDRDGNPFVTAEMLEYALAPPGRGGVRPLPRARCTRWAPSCRSRRLLTRATPELEALAERSPDRSPHRQDEPYRRALSGDLCAPRRHAPPRSGSRCSTACP